MSIKFNVRVGEVMAALLFAGNDEARFVLCGVHFELRDGKVPILVATDGRRLAVIETEAEDQPEATTPQADVTISSDFLKPLCAFAKTQGATLQIEYHPSKRVVFVIPESHCAVDSEVGAVIEGDFPNWRQVIPTGDKHEVKELGLNAALVGDFAKACKLLGSDIPCIRMNLFSQSSAAEVKIPTKPNFYGVIMPMKPEETQDWQPEFLGMESAKSPLAGSTVTIKTSGKEVTVTGEQFSKAANKIAAK